MNGFAARSAGSILLWAIGCVGSPSPLAPGIHGSVGVPHCGVLTNGEKLPQKGDGFERLRKDERNFGNPRLIALLRRAAKEVSERRPGAPMVIGDLSPRFGGQSSGHRSHRNGRDADLLFYVLSPMGVPAKSRGFLRFGPDALAVDGDSDFYRFDTERNWLLVKALLTSPDAHVQWLFVAHWLEALLIEYALAMGEDPELVYYAENVLLQPGDSAAHDDHIHLRIACTPEEAIAGCMGGGPYWPWLPLAPQLSAPPDQELLSFFFEHPVVTK